MKILSTNLNIKQADGFYNLTHGIDVDRFLYREEIQVQMAWIEELTSKGFLTQDEFNSLQIKFQSIFCDIESNDFSWRLEDEDIHMNIERSVTESLGDVGKKMHLGRSRNDLIATTLKLYLGNRCLELANDMQDFIKILISHAERDIEIILPSYTHSQAAQPIRMSQIWLFHALNFKNDAHRFLACNKNLKQMMPLGSSAISGTHLPLDLKNISQRLGFALPPMNSVHGVSDRDGVIEVAQAITIFGLHLSRFCEDIIYYSSSSMKVLELPREWSSGSSIMPNKRNPDFFEVIRAKGKRLMSLSSEILALNAGLTSGYASDFHEQKRSIIESIQNLQKILSVLKEAFASIKTNERKAVELLKSGHILATDVANLYVDQGLTFRDAYREVAKMVTLAEEGNEQVGTSLMAFEDSVERKNNSGGTSRFRVNESISWLKADIYFKK